MKRPLVVLYAADAISLTGNSIAQLAIPWYVLITTGSPALTGLAVFFNFLPTVLAAFFGGVLVDRLGFQRSSVIADLASFAAVAAIPLLDATVGIELWQLMTLVFLGALLDAPGATARAAVVPDLAEMGGVSIERATGLRGSVQQTSQLVGGPLGGVLVATVGATTALWIDAATFLVSAALIAWFVPGITPHHDDDEKSVDARGYVNDLLEGWRFVRRHRVLIAIVLTVVLTNLLDASFPVLMPVLASEEYGGAAVLGLIYGVFGATGLIGSLAYGALGHRISRRKTFLGCFAFVPVVYLVLAATPPLPGALIAVAVSGLAAGPLNPLMQTVAYDVIPARLRGRVLGAIRAGAWASIPAGVLIGGAVAEAFGVASTLLVIGICYIAVTAYGFFNPSFRDLDAGRDAAAGA